MQVNSKENFKLQNQANSLSSSSIIIKDGRTYHVQTEKKEHNCFWMFGRGIQATSAVFRTLLGANLPKPATTLWKEAFTGIEEVEIIQEVKEASLEKKVDVLEKKVLVAASGTRDIQSCPRPNSEHAFLIIEESGANHIRPKSQLYVTAQGLKLFEKFPNQFWIEMEKYIDSSDSIANLCKPNIQEIVFSKLKLIVSKPCIQTLLTANSRPSLKECFQTRTFECADGQVQAVNGFVIQALQIDSSFFGAMLDGNFQESQSHTNVKMPLTAVQFQEVIKQLYDKEAAQLSVDDPDIDWENIFEHLALANKLQIPYLQIKYAVALEVKLDNILAKRCTGSCEDQQDISDVLNIFSSILNNEALMPRILPKEGACLNQETMEKKSKEIDQTFIWPIFHGYKSSYHQSLDDTMILLCGRNLILRLRCEAYLSKCLEELFKRSLLLEQIEELKINVEELPFINEALKHRLIVELNKLRARSFEEKIKPAQMDSFVTELNSALGQFIVDSIPHSLHMTIEERVKELLKETLSKQEKKN